MSSGKLLVLRVACAHLVTCALASSCMAKLAQRYLFKNGWTPILLQVLLHDILTMNASLVTDLYQMVCCTAVMLC